MDVLNRSLYPRFRGKSNYCAGSRVIMLIPCFCKGTAAPSSHCLQANTCNTVQSNFAIHLRRGKYTGLHSRILGITTVPLHVGSIICNSPQWKVGVAECTVLLSADLFDFLHMKTSLLICGTSHVEPMVIQFFPLNFGLASLY